MSRVSVLLTSYNNFGMLEEAMDSLDSQTYKDFEVLLLDDHSPGFFDWVGEGEFHDNYRLYRSNVKDQDRWKTARYAVQVNMGLKICVGEFVAYLTDDDLWMPDKLETVVSFFDRHPEANVVCGYQKMQQLGDGPERPGIRNYRDHPDTNFGDYKVLQCDPAFKVDHSSVVHRWPICGGESGWPTKEDIRCADALYWRQLYRAGNPFYVIPKVLDIHRYHNQSWSSKMDRGEHLK